MNATQPAAKRKQQAPLAEAIRGAVLEVADLESTRSFYEKVFGEHQPGEWRSNKGSLTYQRGGQSVEFVQKRRPRAFPDSGYHWAFRVPPEASQRIAIALDREGHTVSWWREDHPDERNMGPYAIDPSGNVIQLVPSTDSSLFLDHVGIEIHMFDYCEYLYVKILGGPVTYYHGWRTRDMQEAKAWSENEDPCAPWTRRDNPNYRDFLVVDPSTGELRPSRFSAEFGGPERGRLRVPRPNGQVFINYGATRLGLFSASKTRQEPPEEQVKGTPRIIFSTSKASDEVAKELEQHPVPQVREGREFFLRDADGNFCQLICQQ